MTSKRLIWLRNDLRTSDNPALWHALHDGGRACAVYVLDERSENGRPLGAAARWWLHESLRVLASDLGQLGVEMRLRRGRSERIVPDLAQAEQVQAVYWNAAHGPCERQRDDGIASTLRAAGIKTAHYQANTLFAPDDVLTLTGTPYRVFTPFWKAALRRGMARAPYGVPASSVPRSDNRKALAVLGRWALQPRQPDWAAGFADHWRPGEAGAKAALEKFLKEGLVHYGIATDIAAGAGASRLSPHLRFGEISPFQIWHALDMHMARGDAPQARADKFLAEIGWREFCVHMLAHLPDLARRNVRSRFDTLAWRADRTGLSAWRRGETGYPIVDAAMRQLWQTGWMHNRLRMVVASFLCKHLMIDWRAGETWFWDTLVDADAASNPANWQWVAGCGADAAPYFRIFNPMTQGAKFDPQGAFVRRFIPALEKVPDRYVHAPWTMPPLLAQTAGFEPGVSYAAPIVDHEGARKRALAAFRALD